MNVMTKLCFIFFSLVQCSACGSLSKRIPNDAFSTLTIGQRTELLDAYNAINIALDEQEEVAQELAEYRLDLKRAKERRSDVIDDARRLAESEEGGGIGDMSSLSREVANLRILHIKSQISTAQARLRLHDELLLVTEARFELHKAELAKRVRLPVAAKLKVEDFDAQVQKYLTSAQKYEERLNQKREATEARRDEWNTERSKLSSQSAGALGNVWADDTTRWEGWQ